MCVYVCNALSILFSHSLSYSPSSFRKQHEQLQAVIVRVLRSQQQKGQATQVRCCYTTRPQDIKVWRYLPVSFLLSS